MEREVDKERERTLLKKSQKFHRMQTHPSIFVTQKLQNSWLFISQAVWSLSEVGASGLGIYGNTKTNGSSVQYTSERVWVKT